MAQVGFNRELEIILVRLNVGGVNADESQVLPVGVDTGASTTVIPTQVAMVSHTLRWNGSNALYRRVPCRCRGLPCVNSQNRLIKDTLLCYN